MIPSIRRLARNHAPWFILDALVVALSLVLAASVRSITSELNLQRAIQFYVVAVGICFAVNFAFHLYHRIWRYASSGEIFVIAAATAVSTLALTGVDLVWPDGRLVPLSVIPMTGFFSFVGFVTVRYRRRLWTGFRWRWRALGGGLPAPRTRVLIVGAGEAGQLLAWRLLHNKEGKAYDIRGFVDDDLSKHGMRIHGVPVRGDRDDIPALVTNFGVDLIIIAIYNIAGPDFRAILDICEQTPAVIKVLPNIFSLIQSTKRLPPLRDITAEDLLGRKPVEIDRDACRLLLAGKTVLVTGAAGSIGSELCRQIITFGPTSLLMLDNNESGLYDLNLTFDRYGKEAPAREHTNAYTVMPIVADVTNEAKMRAVFDQYRPEIIFHAAAYKHVPLMENFPDEAVRVNIMGTRSVADFAVNYGAQRFVLVSTDKAVKPHNVMGATKRVCEMLVGNGMLASGFAQHIVVHAGDNGKKAAVEGPYPADPQETLPGKQGTLFTTVRFGNVLGSRGSVVPTFVHQIDQGGPVTVTHPDMTRYFMSISEAASLIIQAAALTAGNDIYMLDMGQQIRIDELARRLIRLRGLRPDIDIPITYTGCRPGEKMRERLLGDGEERYATAHPQIFRIRGNGIRDPFVVRNQIDQLICLALAQRNGEVVARLHELAETGKSELSAEKS